VLVKPDIAAADGASSKTPGFLPFFGTSAAAPHAAAIAALIKSVRPGYTNAQILNAMTQTALDIRAVGLDRDSGYGIVMVLAAANYALTH
jgi:subtilisin family serine protease